MSTSTVDQSAAPQYVARVAPLWVRLSPGLATRLLAHLKRPTAAAGEIHGVLFGNASNGMVVAEAFRSSIPEDHSGLDERNWTAFGLAFTQLVQAAKSDPELAAYTALGWYSLRKAGGLTEVDVAFHNRFFRRTSDIAVILRHEEKRDVVFELYTRTSNARLSNEDHRWGSLRLRNDIQLLGPVDVAIRARNSDQSYMRAYEVGKALDRAERTERWRQVWADAKVRMLSIIGRDERDRAYPEPRPVRPGSRLTIAPDRQSQTTGSAAVRMLPREPQSSAQPGIRSRIQAGDPPTLPAVIQPKKKPVPWLSSLIVFVVAFVIFLAASFGFLLTRGPNRQSGIIKALFGDSSLNLKVEGQGERLLLTWNRRNGLVRTAREGLLKIQDGAESRNIRLDSSQVANAAVLYRPHSNDVSFRLEIRGVEGGDIVESTRVLDGSDSAPAAVDVSAAQQPPAVSSVDVPVAQPPAPPPPEVRRSAYAPAPSNRDEKIATTSTVPAPGLQQSSGTSQLALRPAPSTPTDQAASSTTAPPLATPTVSSPPLRHTYSGEQIDGRASGSSLSGWEEPPPNKPQQDSSGLGSSLTTQEPAPVPANPVVAANQGYIPPKPIRQVLPNTRAFYPTSAASIPQVDVVVNVDDTGKVTQAQALHSEKLKTAVLGAVLIAARQWEFQPATLHGKPIPSEHTIVFQFRANNR